MSTPSGDALQDSGLTRRDFLKAAALLTAPAAYPCIARGAAPGAAASAASPAAAYAYVGTYTPNGGGIYLFRMDAGSGALTQLQVFDGIRNPTWLALNRARTNLYAVSEIDNFQGKRSGALVSYGIDGETRQLRRLGAVSSAGTTPVYASVHPSGKF